MTTIAQKTPDQRTGPVFTQRIITEWLDQLVPGTYCGYTSSLSNYPLALCGTWQGFKDVTVSWYSVGWSPTFGKHKRFRTHDRWTAVLVRRIDQSLGSRHEVTATELRTLAALHVDVETAF